MSNGNGSGSPDTRPAPEWLARLGIENGEWYMDSKPRARRAMKSAAFSPAARIYICLGLHTMGFQQELAVKMEAGKKVPLTPEDVCAETSVPRKHFREHFDQLEAWGLAKCEGSTKGRVLLYSWASPRPVQKAKIVPDSGTIPPWCPPDLASVLKRYRIKVPPEIVPVNGTIAELSRLAQGAIQAELSLRKYVDCLRNGPGINKEESNGKKPERNHEAPAPVPAPSPVQSSSSSEPPEPTTTIPVDHASEDTRPVSEAIAKITVADERLVADLVSRCRKVEPTATVREIASVVEHKAKYARKADKPAGFLLTAVPLCFEGPSFQAFRAQQAKQTETRAAPPPPEPPPTLTEPQNVWDEIRLLVKSRITPEGFDNWLRYAEYLRVEGTLLLVSTPDAETNACLETEYRPQITAAIRDLKLPFTRVVYRVRQLARGAAI